MMQRPMAKKIARFAVFTHLMALLKFLSIETNHYKYKIRLGRPQLKVDGILSELRALLMLRLFAILARV